MNAPFLLVRHATAEQGSGIADRDRALTAGGRDAFARLAAEIGREVRLVRVLASPLRRARQTAELLGAATGAEVETDDALASGRSTGRDLLRLALSSGPGWALVGHNPEVAEALALAGGRDERVPPGTVAGLERGPGGTVRIAWIRRP